MEITQKGLRQVQVQPKIDFDFAAAMRAFLQGRPGRDYGGRDEGPRDGFHRHRGLPHGPPGFFSTLHTNSAPETITRLLDMGMDPFNFADAILCILAQRLVRTLCSSCKESYHPSRQEYDELVREYEPEPFEKNVNIPFNDDLRLHRAKGCDACHGTGYRGRMGIHELLMGTDEMRRLIQVKSKMEVIREQALKDGMTTLNKTASKKCSRETRT